MIPSSEFEIWAWIGSVLGSCLIAIVWHFVDFRIRSLMIPRAEIERLAELMIARYGSRAEEMAFIEEDSAWRRSHTEEQGKWRRVRRRLRRMKLAEERG